MLAPAALAAAGVEVVVHPGLLGAGLGRAWPPFTLVAGLWVIGRMSARDGLFEACGAWLARAPGPPITMFVALEALVAAVTAILNLDTAVLFLTPVVLAAARVRGLPERPFVYGAVLMANSASLLLPGSNLTNLLVLGGRAGGPAFAGTMALPWLAATAITAAVVAVAHRRDLGVPAAPPPPAPRSRPRPGSGGLGTALAALAVVFTPQPALPVLATAVALASWRILRRGPGERALLAPAMLAATLPLFALTVVVGGLASAWALPSSLLAHAGVWETAAAGAGIAVAVNNLPAATLLGAHPAANPAALLVGLDVGPNLAVTGSLSAVLWMWVSRECGAEVSAAAYSRLGIAVALPAMAAATGLTLLSGPL